MTAFDMGIPLIRWCSANVTLPIAANLGSRLPSRKPISFDAKYRHGRWDGYARRRHARPVADLHRCGGRRKLFGRRTEAPARAIRGQPDAGESRGAARREALRPLVPLPEADGGAAQPAGRRAFS